MKITRKDFIVGAVVIAGVLIVMAKHEPTRARLRSYVTVLPTGAAQRQGGDVPVMTYAAANGMLMASGEGLW